MGLALRHKLEFQLVCQPLGQRLLAPDMANLLTTIILSSAVLYELVGPASAKLAIFLSGSMQNKPKDQTLPVETKQ